jgi:dihydrodipicolinate synthase/N-acetylneuraminate lyase
MFKGSIVAIVTPFKDGKVDETAYLLIAATRLAKR